LLDEGGHLLQLLRHLGTQSSVNRLKMDEGIWEEKFTWSSDNAWD
jgi:hypothetical protein